MSLSELVGTVPDGQLVKGRFKGVTEGQYSKVRIAWDAQNGEGNVVERYADLEFPSGYNPQVQEAVGALQEGDRVAVVVTPLAKTGVYRTDGASGERHWKAGDRYSMVVLVMRSIVRLDG